jgi:riboflavin-specific deaminase-like protein
LIVQDLVWQQLLDLKQTLDCRKPWRDISYSKESGFNFLNPEEPKGKFEILIHKGESTFSEMKTKSLFKNEIYLSYDPNFCNEAIQVIENYCPILLGNLVVENNTFIIVHMAQTIDGKICTCLGKSKWIGNEENLTHAHRLRAMVDGVLVGGKTVAKDLPRLNVRHVKGENPSRLLLTNSFNEWDKLPVVENAKTILIRSKDVTFSSAHPVIDDVLEYDVSDEDKLHYILKELKKRGIHSILVEGGPSTVGSFLSAGLVDWLQLHIAPIVFGSGKSCISMNEIEEVNEGYQIKNMFHTSMGDAFMLTGEPLINEKNLSDLENLF